MTGWGGRSGRRTSSNSSTLTEWWQTDNVIAERFVLTTTVGIPIGAYHLEVSAAEPDSEEFLPIYRDEDNFPLDKIRLGYVVVPWQGEMDRARPVRANFGDQISLLGFEAVDSLSPGDEFDVALYWEALRPPEDDYVLFVHLVDGAGQVVASHDGPPLEGGTPLARGSLERSCLMHATWCLTLPLPRGRISCKLGCTVGPAWSGCRFGTSRGWSNRSGSWF